MSTLNILKNEKPYFDFQASIEASPYGKYTHKVVVETEAGKVERVLKSYFSETIENDIKIQIGMPLGISDLLSFAPLPSEMHKGKPSTVYALQLQAVH